ncbi:conserved hypothetical protein [Ricinus communis]|uniref:Uncharacterized protein n=1 Tax=Ricinus communis TaxID=3988 RepID=B9SN86_RICCO|nr:conserved hypothetical protein [Ricinus communis]
MVHFCWFILLSNEKERKDCSLFQLNKGVSRSSTSNSLQNFGRAFLQSKALIRHRDIVKLVTSCLSINSRKIDSLALVSEFNGNGSLEYWIKGKRKNEDGDGLNLVERLDVMWLLIQSLQNDSDKFYQH